MAYTTIDNPAKYFQTKLWTGNGSNNRAITLDDTDADLDPDMIWLKKRADDAEDHAMHDTVRGIDSNPKLLNPNTNALEETHGNNGYISAVTADTFTLSTNGSDSDAYQYNNHNTDTYVAWCWKESATAGFDIVTATGNATAKTISHSLSAVPHWMISKERTGSVNDWTVYHHKNTAAPETDSLILNETNTTSDQNTHWNDTAPTSSVFTVGTGSVVNRNSSTYVYYLWSEKKGFSKFGSYTGNGNNDGTFVYTGFSPAWIMIKRTDGTGPWGMNDIKRDFNDEYGNDSSVYANTSGTESTSGSLNVDFLSNGFKLRSDNNEYNNSGGSYVYMTFADSPFVNSSKIPNNARQ